MPTCRRATPRCATARAFISASRCRSCRTSARAGVVAAIAASRGDIGLVPGHRRVRRRLVDRARSATTRRRSSRGFPSSSAPTIRPACRCSRIARPTPGCDRHRRASAGACGSPAGARRLSRALDPLSRSRSRCRTAPSTAPRCSSRCRQGAIDDADRGPGQSRRLGALARPSSAATRPAIPSPPTGARSRPAVEARVGLPACTGHTVFVEMDSRSAE